MVLGSTYPGPRRGGLAASLPDNWAIFFAMMAVVNEAVWRNYIHRFLDRVQAVGRDPRHLVVCRRQRSHADPPWPRYRGVSQSDVEPGPSRMSDAIVLQYRGPPRRPMPTRRRGSEGVSISTSTEGRNPRSAGAQLARAKLPLIYIVCGIVTRDRRRDRMSAVMTNQTEFSSVRTLIGLGAAGADHRRLRDRVGDGQLLARPVRQASDDPTKIEKSLEAPVAVGQAQRRRSWTLSGGMKRRVMIAKALAHEPDILFLDEPTAGVDVELRRDMWELVRELRARRRRRSSSPPTTSRKPRKWPTGSASSRRAS